MPAVCSSPGPDQGTIKEPVENFHVYVTLNFHVV